MTVASSPSPVLALSRDPTHDSCRDPDVDPVPAKPEPLPAKPGPIVSHPQPLVPDLHPETLPHDPEAVAVAAATQIAVANHLTVDFLPPHVSVTQVLANAVHHSDSPHYPAVYAVDLACVARKLRDFRAALPHVTPYYALKCNSDPVLVAFLARLGVSFDCASRYELDLVRSAICDAGHVPDLPDRIIFANPFKMIPDLKYARTLGARLMTFDCVDELYKIHTYYPEASILLRLAVDDSQALCPLSSKFGARMDEVDHILDTVNKLGLNFVGASFHVGSGCTQLNTYVEGLKACRTVFNSAEARGMSASVLDIGGGFPGHDEEAPITFRQIADAIRPVLTRLFSSDVRVIAEPGRYFVAAAYTLATQVVLTRRRRETPCHYLADGVFGSFRDAWILMVKYPAKVLIRERDSCEEDGDGSSRQVCNLFGPTRDAVDVIARGVRLPPLQTGDWLYFENMGAYTMSLATRRSEGSTYRMVYVFRV